MDKNSIIGFVLIFALVLGWQQFLAPSQAEVEAEQQRLDSLQFVQQRADSIAQLPQPTVTFKTDSLGQVDSSQLAGLSRVYGAFAYAIAGEEKEVTIENDLMKVTLTNKGGRVKEVLLKKYFKAGTIEEGDKKYPLLLLEDNKNKFDYKLPVPGTTNGSVNSSDLIFEVQQSGNAVTFRANAGNGRYFEQRYALTNDTTYALDYNIGFSGLNDVLARDAQTIELNWVNYLDKLERNVTYERTMSSVYFRPVEDDVDYCSCSSDDKEIVDDEQVAWVANANQFFNSVLMTKDKAFTSGVFETRNMTDEEDDLKELTSTIQIPYDGGATNQQFAMQFYVGPKEYNRLQSFDTDLEYTVPFGISIFGTVNRYIIRPVFGFLSGIIGDFGLVILALTLLVKLCLYPLTYRMLHSQSKMAALKPQLEKIREKHKDDQQQQQMETMKMYREFGANPLGGCLPMVLQMPIWFALYRFFPASIEFRQTPFLWADDLSSFDVFAQLPFAIPFYGAHVSLFTLLWALTTVAYVFYNSRHMDMSAMSNPAMKYMQYFMPLMFVFFFNNFASGLTAYLFFSNLTNILQTFVTKNYIINQDKIKKELEDYRKKPKKKKSGFQQRLEEAMKQQQQIQVDREKNSGKRKKK